MENNEGLAILEVVITSVETVCDCGDRTCNGGSGKGCH